jgi:hypothetical protein
MTPPAPSPSSTKRIWIWIVIALAVVAVIVIIWATSPRSMQPIYGSCIKPDGTVLAAKITRADCQNRCPTCTWRQEN